MGFGKKIVSLWQWL